jgi:hypothetical protein
VGCRYGIAEPVRVWPHASAPKPPMVAWAPPATIVSRADSSIYVILTPLPPSRNRTRIKETHHGP